MEKDYAGSALRLAITEEDVLGALTLVIRVAGYAKIWRRKTIASIQQKKAEREAAEALAKENGEAVVPEKLAHDMEFRKKVCIIEEIDATC